MAFSDFCVAARRLFPKAAYRRSEQALERDLAMIGAMPRRILIGLRERGGEWISLAGGWYIGDRAILNLQLNNLRVGRESISLVLRSYLIEALIDRGFRGLLFWGGAAGPLSFYSVSPELFRAYVDAPSLPWRLCRLACATVGKLAPAASCEWLKWIVPGGVT